MAAVNIFDVKPQIVLMGQFEGQLIILHVAASGQNIKPVFCAHGERSLRLFFFTGLFPSVFQDARRSQFRSDIGYVPVRGSAIELFLYACNIIQLFLRLFDQLRQIAFRSFQLV